MKKLHLVLCAVALAVSAWSADRDAAPSTKVHRIGVEEFDRLRANTNCVLLDVRSVAEFEKGRIPGALNIDFNTLSFSNKVHAFDRDKVYLVHCAVGVRSARACRKMESMGFKELYDLGPGFDGWKKLGKPIEK